MPHPTVRRRLALAALLACSAGLTACVTPLPAMTWMRLPLELPGSTPPTPGPSGPGNGTAPASKAPHLLLLPVQLAGHLDRDAWVVVRGPGTLQASPQGRWAEPLRDSIPRVLRHDLEHLLGGGRVWNAPLPAGASSTQRLRVDILAFEFDPATQTLHLHARWQVSGGSGPGTVEQADWRIPAASAGLDDVVLAHRQALRQLAVRIADSVPPSAD